MPTRQTSSSGKPKSPRIQVVLPEDLCARLTAMAELESRTVSNMARVLIQQGVQRHEQELEASIPAPSREERLRSALESQQPRRCLLYTSPSPRDGLLSRMPSSA